MKIPLVYIPKSKLKRFLHIERRFKAQHTIIPLGCDCHPAYCLQKLHIRTQSFPFDWLNTSASKGILYVNNNIRVGFKHFLEDLTVNDHGNVISAHYPYAEFIHEKDLATNLNNQLKFTRRTERFQKALQRETVSFLYNIPVAQIINEVEAEELVTSVTTFVAQLKKSHHLHIYLRYDESENENADLANTLSTALQNIKGVTVVKYVRQLNRYGIWGNKNQYPDLFKKLGIPIKQTFPKIYIK
jgi:hypothetical protein